MRTSGEQCPVAEAPVPHRTWRPGRVAIVVTAMMAAVTAACGAGAGTVESVSPGGSVQEDGDRLVIELDRSIGDDLADRPSAIDGRSTPPADRTDPEPTTVSTGAQAGAGATTDGGPSPSGASTTGGSAPRPTTPDPATGVTGPGEAGGPRPPGATSGPKSLDPGPEPTTPAAPTAGQGRDGEAGRPAVDDEVPDGAGASGARGRPSTTDAPGSTAPSPADTAGGPAGTADAPGADPGSEPGRDGGGPTTTTPVDDPSASSRSTTTIARTTTTATAPGPSGAPDPGAPSTSTAPSAGGGQVEELERRFAEALADLREEHRLPPFRLDDGMNRAARDWSLEMARRASLEHAPDITVGLPSTWELAAENVGVGNSVEDLMEAFLDSDDHRVNILNPAYRALGVGVTVTDSGRIYVTHRFAKLSN